MNQQLLNTIKKALLRMYKQFTGESLKTDSKMQYITIENKKQLFDNEAIKKIREEIADACRDNLIARDRMSQ